MGLEKKNRNTKKLGIAILISSCDFLSFYLLTVIIKGSRIARKKISPAV